MPLGQPKSSLLKKVLIGLSQLLVIVPGAYLAYIVTSFLETQIQFKPGTDPVKLIVGLVCFAACSAPFGFLWFAFMKKTGLSETEEFRFMMGIRDK